LLRLVKTGGVATWAIAQRAMVAVPCKWGNAIHGRTYDIEHSMAGSIASEAARSKRTKTLPGSAKKVLLRGHGIMEFSRQAK